jgi:HlyD family secretion protein
MKKKTLITTGIIAIIGIAAILILKPFSKKDAAVSFDTVKVEKGNISNIVRASGSIEAIKTVNVGTQVSGILEHVYVDFNDNVKEGQLLAKLDETSLKAQLDQSQSAVNMAQAQLNFQEATYNRLKVLFEKKLIAQADFDQAVFNYENSKGSLSNAKSALQRAMVNLDYATITSPINGVILNRAVEEGQTVAASFNTPTLFTIVNDLTQMEVHTSIDEADIGKVKQGQRVEFTVDAYPDMNFEGKVSELRLQPVTTNNVVTYVVILSAPNPEKKLMPGMTAVTDIYVEEKQNTLILPGKAIRFTPDPAYLQKLMKRMKPGNNGLRKVPAAAPSVKPPLPGTFTPGMETKTGEAAPGTKRVWVKDETGGIHPVNASIGIDNGLNVEILSGLKEGDEVIVSMSSVASKTKTSKTSNAPRGPFPF